MTVGVVFGGITPPERIAHAARLFPTEDAERVATLTAREVLPRLTR
jgi:hypothetical protein